MNTLTLLCVMCFLDRVFLGLRSKSCSIGIPRVSNAPQRPYQIWSPSTNPKRKGTTSGPQLWQQLKYQSLLLRIICSCNWSLGLALLGTRVQNIIRYPLDLVPLLEYGILSFCVAEL